MIHTLRNWLAAANARTDAQLRGLAALAQIAQRTGAAKAMLQQAQTALDHAMQAERDALGACEAQMLHLIALRDATDAAHKAGQPVAARQGARAIAAADNGLARLRDTARDCAQRVQEAQDMANQAAFTLITLKEAAIAARALRPEHLNHAQINATLAAC